LTASVSTKGVEQGNNRDLDGSLDRSLDFYKDFPNAIVTTSNGEPIDVDSILPSKAVPMPESRSDLEMYNVDGVILENVGNMQSGQISWQEMAVQGLHSCGRSSLDKRPRFIALQQEVVAKNLTKVETVTATATDTVTFSVELQTCTTAGFTFAVPTC